MEQKRRLSFITQVSSYTAPIQLLCKYHDMHLFFFFNLGPAFFSHTFIHQPAWLKFGVKYVSRMPYVRKARDVHLTAASYHTIGIFQWLRGLRIIKSRWINGLLWQREKKHSKKSRGRQPFWLFLTFARWDLPDLVDHPLPTCCEDFFYLLTRSCG